VSLGIQVFNADGSLLWEDGQLLMRVIGTIHLRDSRKRRAAWDVPTPLAGPGVIPMVQPVPGAYVGTSVDTAGGPRGYIPVVTVHDGFIRLQCLTNARRGDLSQGNDWWYTAMLDIVLVRIR
jgi:hypothetical protein